MDYKIAIPSHNRSNIIKSKTLAFLSKHNIPKDNIYIFVAEDEIATYKKNLPTYNIIKGSKGLKNNRSSISLYFDENTRVCSIDDDVKDIINFKKDYIKNLDYLIKDIFNYLEATGLKLGGIHPCDNPFFYAENISNDLKFICGAFRCFINTRLCERRTFTLLEDYETTIRYYLYCGGVARFNHLGVIANYKTLSGGLKEYRTDDLKKKEVEEFSKKYSNFCKTKKEGMEIQLIKNPQHDAIFGLWIQHEEDDFLPPIQKLCLSSMVRQGYIVELYTNLQSLGEELDPFIKSKQIKILNPFSILKYNEESKILPYSDLFRYKVLYEKGGTWIDLDMILLDRLPSDEIIISSEHTFQSGAFKSKQTFTPNIGVLRFTKHNELLNKVIDEIQKKQDADFTDNMKVFKKHLKKYNYSISDPNTFCPVPWWCVDELYKDTEKFTTKYSVEVKDKSWILNNSTAVHLWNNFSTKLIKNTFKKSITKSPCIFQYFSLFNEMQKLILN